MNRITGRKFAPVVLIFASLLGAPQVAVAAGKADPPSDQHFTLLAGSDIAGCPFDMQVDLTGSKATVKEFRDANGKVVRVITAGKGYTKTYTNLNTGKVVVVKASGSVQKETRDLATGISTFTSTGHSGLILFSTDFPAGPTTTEYSGRVVYTVDQQGVFRVQSTSGGTRDICAELAR